MAIDPVGDRGAFLSARAVGRQLAAMPCDLYLVRLIHFRTRRAFPGERIWTAAQLSHEATVRFLRARNREGCDVYIQPYADDRNAGYILVDLDDAAIDSLERMRINGHEPCVVLQTSPGHFQAWIHVSASPLEPAVASALGRHLARTYGGDLASSDWRHLGRLVGFTNQKPQRCHWYGRPPWVKVLETRPGVATESTRLLQQAEGQLIDGTGCAAVSFPLVAPPNAAAIYQTVLKRLRIPERFPHPDWSIADKWIAKELLRGGLCDSSIAAIIEEGSPGFPRRHTDPHDYLRRTIARAIQETDSTFPGYRARRVDEKRCR